MTIGIYAIVNKVNLKMYIGKSKSIENRFKEHLRMLRKEDRNKNCNRYLYNAFKKYGEECFYLRILETFDTIDESALSASERNWMLYYNTIDGDFGYNLRLDSSTKMIVHSDTRRLISENNRGANNPNYGNKWSDAQKNRAAEIIKENIEKGIYAYMQTEEHRRMLSNVGKELWKDEEKKRNMAKRVSENRSEHYFEQYNKKSGEFVARFENMQSILEKYPDFHRIAIYSVCNGWKKSYRGFIWKSFLKEKV